MTRRQKFHSNVYAANKSVSEHSPCPRFLQCESEGIEWGDARGVEEEGRGSSQGMCV